MSESDQQNITKTLFEDIPDALTGGVARREVKKGLDQLTGRDLQIEQMRRAEARIQEEKAAKEKLLEEEKVRAQRLDLQSSIAAGRTKGLSNGPISRKTGVSNKTNNYSKPEASLLGGQKDFLGL